MNWVGGARSRIRRNNEEKKQKDFFKRKRMESAKEFSKIKTSSTPALSRDLLIFNFLQIKSRKSNVEPKPTKIIKEDLEKINYNNTRFINIPETPLDSISTANKQSDRYDVKKNMEDTIEFKSHEDSRFQINKEFNTYPENLRRTEKASDPKIFSAPGTILRNSECKLYNPLSYDRDSIYVDSPGRYRKEQVEELAYQNRKDQQNKYLREKEFFHQNGSSTRMHNFRENIGANIRHDINYLHQNELSPSVLKSYADTYKSINEKPVYSDKLCETLRKPIINPSESDFIFKPSPVIKNKYFVENNEDFTCNAIRNNSLLNQYTEILEDNIKEQHFERIVGDDECLGPSRGYLHSTDFINSPTGNKPSSSSATEDPANVLHSEIAEDFKRKRSSKHLDTIKNINKNKSILKSSKSLKCKTSRVHKQNLYLPCNEINRNTYGNDSYEELGEISSKTFCERKHILNEEFDYYPAFQQRDSSIKESKYLPRSNISSQNFLPEYSQIYSISERKNAFDISNGTQALFGNDDFCASDKLLSETEANKCFTNQINFNSFADHDLKKLNKQVKNTKDAATSPILPKFSGNKRKYLNDAIFYDNALQNPVPDKTPPPPMLKSRILKTCQVVNEKSLNTVQNIDSDKNYDFNTKAFHTVHNDLKRLALCTPKIPKIQFPVAKDTNLRNLPPTVPNSPSILNLASINFSSVNENITKTNVSIYPNKSLTCNEPGNQYNELNSNRNIHGMNHVKDNASAKSPSNLHEDLHVTSLAELSELTRKECDNHDINKANTSVKLKTIRKHLNKIENKSGKKRNSIKTNLFHSFTSNQSAETEVQSKCPYIESNEYPNPRNLFKGSSHSDPQYTHEELLAPNLTEPSNSMKNEISGNNANKKAIIVGFNTINEYGNANDEFHLANEEELNANKLQSISETAKLCRNALNEPSKSDKELNNIPHLFQIQEFKIFQNNLSNDTAISESLNSSKGTISCKELPEVSQDDPNTSFNRVSEIEDMGNKSTEDQSFENKRSEVSLSEEPYPDENNLKFSIEIKFNEEVDKSTSENASISQQSPKKSDLLKPLNNVSGEDISSMNPSMTEKSCECIDKNIAPAIFQDGQCSPYKLLRNEDSRAPNIYVDISTQTYNNSADFSCQVNI